MGYVCGSMLQRTKQSYSTTATVAVVNKTRKVTHLPGLHLKMERRPAQGAKSASERRANDSGGRALTHLTAVAEQHTDTHESDEKAGDSDNNCESAIGAQLDAGARPMQLSPVAPFVSKAYAIVNGEPDGIVSWWESDGEDTFVIKRVDVFQEQVLPRFFSHRNYSSFVRQLNNHGVCKICSKANRSQLLLLFSVALEGSSVQQPKK